MTTNDSAPTRSDIDERIAGQNVAKRFLANVAENGSLTAIQWKGSGGEWDSITFDELADRTARLATALADLGVGHGDRVALMLSNRMEFHPLDLAVLFLGATPVSVYNSSAPDQIQYLLADCGAKVAIVEHGDFLARLDQVRDRIGSLEHVVIVDADDATDASVLRYDDLVTAEPIDLASAAETATLDDLATIIYTSGTTGPPKGVTLSHRNVVWTLESISETMRDQTDIDSFAGKKHVSYLPMAHIMERLLGHYYNVDFGTEVTCCPDTSKVAAVAAEVHPHVFIGVPRVWEKLYAGVNASLGQDPERKRKFDEAVDVARAIEPKMTRGTASDEELETWSFLDQVAFQAVKERLGLDRAEICITGAAPIPAEILSWFRALGVPLSEGYGLSETMAVLTWAADAKPGYVGRAATGVEMKLDDDGEVLARGGNVFGGYLGLPDTTDEALDADGWFHTGDIGEIDDDGYLRIVDRKKELIITAGGKNVSPANLEAALKMIPLVGQACAIGDGKPFISALVVLDPDAAAAWAANHDLTGAEAEPTALAENPDLVAEIDEGVRAAMSEFNNAESVKKVKVLGDEWLPDSEVLTPTSKLKRRGIHAQFAEEIDQLYRR
ncbi:AMP-dependent synthetase/ligase [Ilumatobacter sp.]|uniref:AMP-dependent synthetase/ligase n=1 Tax=Ilumatobacter sp. TaxID=1967498 RepID=UPI003B528794